MALFDLPLAELEAYEGAVTPPADFDHFWASTLRAADEHDLEVRIERVEAGLSAFETFDVTFAGFGGHPVRAWLHFPRGAANVPVVVQYQAYGGGRGLSHESILWPAAGFATLVVDTRGQGSGWSMGETGDPVGSAAAHPGFMTRGVLDPNEYYYRRVFVDAVRAISVAGSISRIDATRIAVAGVSQGGGVALAVAGLVPELISTALCDVPGLCDFPRAIDLAERDPYLEFVNYLGVHRDKHEQVLRTLSYFDGVLFAKRARARALFSIALMDRTCPPSAGFAAFNAYVGDKELALYPYNDHEGGGAFHQARQIALLNRVWQS